MPAATQGRQSPVVRSGCGAPPGDAGLLAPRLRVDVDRRSDGGDGGERPQPLHGVRDKKRLFFEAMRFYAGDPEATARAIDGAATAHDAAHAMLVGAAIAYTGEATPKGCLLASATASGSSLSVDVQRAVAEVRRGIERHLSRRIDRDVADGVLPAGTQAAVLASLVMAVIQACRSWRATARRAPRCWARPRWRFARGRRKARQERWSRRAPTRPCKDG